MAERRFPAPWSVEETDAGFIVREVNGQHVASDPGRFRSSRSDDRCGTQQAARPWDHVHLENHHKTS